MTAAGLSRNERQLLICSLAEARRLKRSADSVLSIHDTATRRSQRLSFHRNPRPKQLTLFFDDIESNDQIQGHMLRLPTIEHVQQALLFFHSSSGSVLVHCHAGVSRSAGIGLMFLADMLGPGRERDALEELLSIRPQAVPNSLLVALADQVLQRDGQLISEYRALLERRPDWQEHKRRQTLQLL